MPHSKNYAAHAWKHTRFKNLFYLGKKIPMNVGVLIRDCPAIFATAKQPECLQAKSC